MFLVGYARISTKDQNTELQINALKEVNCQRIFIEQSSGAQCHRPELIAAIDYMRAGDTLVVWKLDRLARSLKQLIETAENLESRNIGLRSLTETIDTTTPNGRLIFHVFASLAEFERSLIRERTMAGLKAAHELGRKGGRPSALTKKDLQVAKAMLKDPQITVKEVAKRLKASISTLYRYIPGGRSIIQEREDI